MHKQRTAALGRRWVKPVVTGALVLMLLGLAWASASPCLHEWLHSDHQAPTHYCVVAVMEHGQNESPNTGVSVASLSAHFPAGALQAEFFSVSQDPQLFPERGPPVLS